MLRVGLAIAMAALLVGCHMRPTPLSVQAGGSFAIGVDGSSQVGFGAGTSDCSGRMDRQRGRLAWTLDPPNPALPEIALETRLTTVLRAPDAAPQGIAPSPHQILSLVNVPPSVAPGTYTLRASQETCTGGAALPGLLTPFPSVELKVLPAIISVGTPPDDVTIFGFPYLLSAGAGLPPLIEQSVPAPTVEIRLSAAVWSAELTLAYDDDRIELLDAIAWNPDTLMAEHRPQQAWVRRTAPGRAEVSAVAREAAFPLISLVFELEPGAQPLDPTAACDCNGECTGFRVCTSDYRSSAGVAVSASHILAIR